MHQHQKKNNYMLLCCALQATWALKGVDCQAVTAKLVGPNPENPNQNVPNLLRAAMVQDFQNALRTSWPEAVSTVRGTVAGQPCLDSTVSGRRLVLIQSSECFHVSITV
jgi:hypothetical protein